MDSESVVSDDRGVDVAPLVGRPEAARPPPDTRDAIVVGAVGSAAPWFLTGWAHEVKVEFMIDTGCQVPILATTIFKRMCTSDPRVRSMLRPCRRRLVSADSSPLTVKDELELKVVFPGLCCDMLWWPILVWMACWVWNPCSRACHISWIFVHDSCGRPAI